MMSCASSTRLAAMVLPDSFSSASFLSTEGCAASVSAVNRFACCGQIACRTESSCVVKRNPRRGFLMSQKVNLSVRPEKGLEENCIVSFPQVLLSLQFEFHRAVFRYFRLSMLIFSITLRMGAGSVSATLGRCTSQGKKIPYMPALNTISDSSAGFL